MRTLLSALGKIGVVLAIAASFIIGMAGTVYLSLRSPEVQVPNIVGKNKFQAESDLDTVDLNMRTRATRYSKDAKPDTVLDQSPQAGDVVKAGQTIAVVVSRTNLKEGEDVSSEATPEPSPSPDENRIENKNEDASNKNERKKSGDKSINKNSNKNTVVNNQNRNGNINANAHRSRVVNANVNQANRNVNSNVNRNNSNVNANKRPAVTITPPPLNQRENLRVP